MEIFKNQDYTNKISWPDLHYYHDDFEFIFVAEQKIIDNSEEFIYGLEVKFGSKVASDEQLKNKPNDENEEIYQAGYYDHYYGHEENAIKQIKQNQRKSSVLSIFSLIEGNLRTLCRLVEGEFDFKVKIDDLNGNDYIHQHWMYLGKVFEIDLSKLESYYTPINQQRYIRNKIAHNNSIIDAKKIESVRQTPGLSVISYGSINRYELEINSYIYIHNLLSAARKFFNKLIYLIDERYKIIKASTSST